MRPVPPSLHEQVPDLMEREFVLGTVLRDMEKVVQGLRAKLADVPDPREVLPMAAGAQRIAEQRRREQRRRCYVDKIAGLEDAITLVAALAGRAIDKPVSLERVRIDRLLSRAPVSRACHEIAGRAGVDHADNSLVLAKESVAEYGVARPFVQRLLRRDDRRHAFALLDEAQQAMPEALPAAELMTCYVTVTLLNVHDIIAEHGRLHGDSRPPHPDLLLFNKKRPPKQPEPLQPDRPSPA